MDDTLASKPDHICLFDVATPQMGYFTAAQARECGFSWDLLSYHARTGRYQRIQHGLYRIRDFPSTLREEVMAAWLTVGKEVAVVSHDSALDLYDLSDNIPNAVHLTVSRSHRNNPKPPQTVVHTTTRPLQQSDVWRHEGMRVTSPARTIIDAADIGVGPEQIEMAVAQALRRGLVTRDELDRQVRNRSTRVRNLIRDAMNLAPR